MLGWAGEATRTIISRGWWDPHWSVSRCRLRASLLSRLLLMLQLPSKLARRVPSKSGIEARSKSTIVSVIDIVCRVHRRLLLNLLTSFEYSTSCNIAVLLLLWCSYIYFELLNLLTILGSIDTTASNLVLTGTWGSLGWCTWRARLTCLASTSGETASHSNRLLRLLRFLRSLLGCWLIFQGILLLWFVCTELRECGALSVIRNDSKEFTF